MRITLFINAKVSKFSFEAWKSNALSELGTLTLSEVISSGLSNPSLFELVECFIKHSLSDNVHIEAFNLVIKPDAFERMLA